MQNQNSNNLQITSIPAVDEHENSEIPDVTESDLDGVQTCSGSLQL